MQRQSTSFIFLNPVASFSLPETTINLFLSYRLHGSGTIALVGIKCLIITIITIILIYDIYVRVSTYVYLFDYLMIFPALAFDVVLSIITLNKC